jgi:FMN phosphatase YigB (HAD superfamily)
VIGLDCDGVIFDYVTCFMEWAERQGIRLGCRPEEMDSWDMGCAFPDLDDAAIWKLIQDFSVHEDFGALRAFDGAFETISALVAEFPDSKLVAITSAGTSEETKNLRVANLAGLPFHEVNVLPLGASKSSYLSQLPPGSVYVDDLHKHVLAAESVGVTGILYRQRYNLADEHPRVAWNWAEAGNHIREVLSAPKLREAI